MSISLAVDFAVVTCFKCGTPFAAPQHFVTSRKQDHKEFYCPNGHGQFFPQQTEAERLREQVKALEADRDWYRKRGQREQEGRESAERSLRATRGVVTRMKRRVAAGVCPCCNRHFEDLQRHMATKHAEFASEDAA